MKRALDWIFTSVTSAMFGAAIAITFANPSPNHEEGFTKKEMDEINGVVKEVAIDVVEMQAGQISSDCEVYRSFMLVVDGEDRYYNCERDDSI